MGKELLIIIAIVFIGIPGIISLFLHSKVRMIMKEIDDTYSGHINNTFDVFRVLKAYRDSNKITNDARILVRNYLILIGISWLTTSIIILLVIFQNEQIFNY
ncbi:MAG TPA: hypothetical protein DEO70_14840 [Bacteroidales bacterium]|nr:MAG: hypothetical protein A2X11_09690 [Bacteroidetes bacterium GWE2_42_24]OFY27897.1 MAG: hypothetical protein A2X09_15170 [Bacteroidetes bacterium GWF2_43_11]HBZ68108.1 hypothetical protein [Bacteroidales bacterium]